MSRKRLQGRIISDKMTKSRVVQIERTVRHPKYEKVMRKSKRLMVHDEFNRTKTGDVVEIEESRPLSARKRWRIIHVVARAANVDVARASARESSRPEGRAT